MVRPGFKAKQKRRRTLVGSLLFLVLIGSMFLHLWIRNYINNLYRDIEQLRRKEAMLVAHNRTLQIEIETLNRPDRIKTIALNDLEMVFPYPETLAVVIEPTTKLVRNE